MEWRNENPARARTIFQEGATFTSVGKPDFYGPLYEAWLQFEEAQGERENAKVVSAELTRIRAVEERLERLHAPLSSGQKPNMDAVAGLSNAILETLA